MKISALKSIFPGDSEMAQRMRTFDWAKNELGSPDAWPAALRTSVRFLLTFPYPMFIWWGDNLINLYNDAFASFLHTQHPSALGKPARRIWPQWRDIIESRIEFAKDQDSETFDEAMPFVTLRRGYPELIYVTFSYSPILNDNGEFAGILCPLSEETDRILNRRQTILLRHLATKTLDSRNRKETFALIADVLASNLDDIPFALLYELNTKLGFATLELVTGISCETPAAPKILSLKDHSVWPLKDVLEKNFPVMVSDLKQLLADLPNIFDEYSVSQAILMPLAHDTEGRKEILVVGLNPLRPFDDNYREFLHLICSGISSAIQNADAYEAQSYYNISHEFVTHTPAKTKVSNDKQILKQLEGKLLIELADARKLQYISSRLIEKDNINALCEQILDVAMEIMTADFSSLQILQPQDGELHLVAWRNFHPESAVFWQKISIHSGTSCSLALHKRERIIVPDVNILDFEKTENLRHCKLSGINAAQSTPIKTRGGK